MCLTTEQSTVKAFLNLSVIIRDQSFFCLLAGVVEEFQRILSAGTLHAQMKEILLPQPHPDLCCCTGLANFFRLTEALPRDVRELAQDFKL